MARPRSKKTVKPRAVDLSSLSTEVLRLRLQHLNLPITGSRARLIERLRQATTPAAAAKKSRPNKGRPTTRGVRKSYSAQRSRTRVTRDVEPSEQDDGAIQSSDDENNALSDADFELEDLLDDTEPNMPNDVPFTPAQLSAIQDTVTSSVQEAFRVFQDRETQPGRYDTIRTPSPRRSNVATPLGLNRPLDKSLEDKILRGEYIDFTLLLPDSIYRSQSPGLQLRYEESSPGSQGSPLTLVKRKKLVIDSFQKWLDAFTSYMLVIVAVHPNRALELIKYQQIISKAVTKFKGLAWLSYDEQFRRRAAYDLSIAWDKIDLELWTVTFAGLAKPHCSVCSSPYHLSEDCPNQDPTSKPRRQTLVCFDFNKPSGCQRRSCRFPHTCRRCGATSHALFNCPSSKQTTSSTKSATSGDRSKR